jgi:hypothetical protein
MEKIKEITRLSAEELSRRIDELGGAFAKRCDIDPRKCVMIVRFDYVEGRYIYFYEKKRGRTRKEILKNIKTPQPTHIKHFK